MNLTYEWSISGVACMPSWQGNANVVSSITYTIVGKDSDSIDSTTIFGTVNTFTLETGEAFIPYENLTQNTMITWVQTILGNTRIQTYQDNMAHTLAVRQNPLVNMTLPWANNTSNTA
jgi:hypothetical protein